MHTRTQAKLDRPGRRWLPAALLAVALPGLAGAPAPARPRPVPGGVDPRPRVLSLVIAPPRVVVNWTGLGGPFQVEATAALGGSGWQAIGTLTTNRTQTVKANPTAQLFRVSARVPNYLGADVCARCHPGLHGAWAQSAHAQAWTDLQALGQATNATCLRCHTVGHGLPTGYTDPVATPGLAGVQCENCHGPGGEHAASPFEVPTPVVRLDSEMCGGCHNGFHHPTYPEWKGSGHATALAPAQGSSLAVNDCQTCHSQDYRYAQEQGTRLPAISAAKYSVECSTCHEPHGATTQDTLLRQPVTALCGECHSQADAPLGGTPHHPQLEMLQGLGPLAEDGTAMTNVGPHTAILATNGCAYCHVVPHTVAQPNYAAPTMTGHGFDPFDSSDPLVQATQYTACLACHNARTIDPFRRGLQAETDLRMAALAPYFDPQNAAYLNPARLSPRNQQRLKVAQFNYQFVKADGSRGVHNPDNAEAALLVAKGIIDSLTQP